MKETMIMDGHEYFKREDGIWETKDRFEMDMTQWATDGNHIGHFGVFLLSGNDVGCPVWVAIDEVGKSNLHTVRGQEGVAAINGQDFSSPYVYSLDKE